ncbi:hypothetical protein KIW84_060370 [Lathyrus oleraceus]|uniref:Reticulon domain-containing protein n=1 Tax=Pisum sativum TaxID=3888 RepID=A0A9D5A2R4_PEA|nr:hypothetical protein KIW84_060370 [Pisum sativum]
MLLTGFFAGLTLAAIAFMSISPHCEFKSQTHVYFYAQMVNVDVKWSSSILVLALLFLWSNAHTFIHKTPPHIPLVHLPEEPFLQFASALRIEINRGFSALRFNWKKQHWREGVGFLSKKIERLHDVGFVAILTAAANMTGYLDLVYASHHEHLDILPWHVPTGFAGCCCHLVVKSWLLQELLNNSGLTAVELLAKALAKAVGYTEVKKKIPADFHGELLKDLDAFLAGQKNAVNVSLNVATELPSLQQRQVAYEVNMR